MPQAVISARASPGTQRGKAVAAWALMLGAAGPGPLGKQADFPSRGLKGCQHQVRPHPHPPQAPVLVLPFSAQLPHASNKNDHSCPRGPAEGVEISRKGQRPSAAVTPRSRPAHGHYSHAMLPSASG